MQSVPRLFLDAIFFIALIIYSDRTHIFRSPPFQFNTDLAIQNILAGISPFW